MGEKVKENKRGKMKCYSNFENKNKTKRDTDFTQKNRNMWKGEHGPFNWYTWKTV